MRFADTIDGWQEQLEIIQSTPVLANFIRAISKDAPRIVRVEKQVDVASYRPAMCHDNVKEHVRNFSGQHMFGWIIRPWTLFDIEFDGMLMAVFHSNWLSSDGDLLSITPEPTNFHIFLPDKLRRFNFDTLESYNNRVIYLNSYKPPLNAFNPTRNVNYYFAGGFADRNKNFERYRIPRPNEKVEDLIPKSMLRVIDGSPHATLDGQKYLSLKYSIQISS